MDEDCDVDKDFDSSLADLHHGLDSSMDDNASGNGKDGTLAGRGIKMNNSDEMADDQMGMLQDMVLEMKNGFQSALEELAKIQEKEEGEANHSKQLQQQQQRQLDDLTETLHEIKDQLKNLTKNVEQIKDDQQVLRDDQKSMRDHIEEVRTSRRNSRDLKSRTDGDRPDLLDDFTSPPDEWTNKLSELPTTADDQDGSGVLANGFGSSSHDNDITATACKSLSLTQALGEKCLNLNLSESSDDEGEPENRRVSHYTPKTAQLILGEAGNRRHSMPANTTPQSRHKDIGRAAQRQKAVKELADSERDYCSQLWSLLHTYLTPLQTAGFLSARELGVLFPPYLDQLYAEHCQICTGLQDKLVHWTYMGSVADLLARVTDSHSSDSLLSLYKEYAEDLPSAVTCLRRAVAQSSEFKSFLKAIKHSSCQSEDLMSLIMAPVQHIPRYLLQLQQVAHHTSPTHPDSPLLQSSLHRLRSFVDQLNEDVANTMTALAQDRSDGDNNPVLSARDSGVHSNSTEEDNITSARAPSRTERSHVLPEWLDDPYYTSHHRELVDDSYSHHRQVRPSARLAALSQPDLTTYNDFSVLSADPSLISHIPRSQSDLPGDADAGGNVVAGRQHRKYKVKKRHVSPVNYTGLNSSSQDHLHHNLSPRVRPSSAIDFLSHSQHHQHYHPHAYRDLSSSVRGYQYPGPQPRPHSAMGPLMVDPHHRPTIISRKYVRRSQPPMPASNSYWAESSTSVPFRTGHLRGPLSAHDLLPTRPSPYHNSAMLDDEDEEDDTRASDNHSLGTSGGSHQLSSSHCSNDGQEKDSEFSPGHLDGQSPHNYGLVQTSGFTSDEVTASLARKLVSEQKEMGREEEVITKHPGNVSTSLQAMPTLEEQVSVKTLLQRNCEEGSSNERQRLSKDYHGNKAPIDSNPSIDFSSTKSKTNTDSFDKESEGLTSNSAAAMLSQVVMREKSESVHSNCSLVNAISDTAKSNLSLDSESNPLQNGFTEPGSSNRTDEAKHLKENNRQFLISLTQQRSPTNSRNNGASKNNTNNSTEDKTNHSNKTPLKGRQTSTFDSSPDDVKSALSKCNIDLNIPQPSWNENGKSVSPQSNHPSNRLSQPLPGRMHTTNEVGREIEPDSSTVSPPSYKYQKSRYQVVSPNNLTQPKSPPSSHPQQLNHNRPLATSLDSHQSSSKPNPFLTTSFTDVVGSNNSAVLETAIDSPRDTKVVPRMNAHSETMIDDINSYPDHHQLPPLEIPETDQPDEDSKKRESRKKMKDGGKYFPADSLPKAGDDPVGARKKMHFKASIKNLFSKKKGRVILADVEREVVMEMATAAAAGTTATTPTSTTASKTSFKLSLSPSKKENICNQSSPNKSPNDKTTENSAFEIKTRKDQGSSTSSPIKVCKLFHPHAKEEKQSKVNRDCRELSCGEFEQLQQQQSTLERLKAGARHRYYISQSQTQTSGLAESDGAQEVIEPMSDKGHCRKILPSSQENDCQQPNQLGLTTLTRDKVKDEVGETSSAFPSSTCRLQSCKMGTMQIRRSKSNENSFLRCEAVNSNVEKPRIISDHSSSNMVTPHPSSHVPSKPDNDHITQKGQPRRDSKEEFHKNRQKVNSSKPTLCPKCQHADVKCGDGKVNSFNNDAPKFSHDMLRNSDSNDKIITSSKGPFVMKPDTDHSVSCNLRDKKAGTLSCQQNILLNNLNDDKRNLLYNGKVENVTNSTDPAGTSLVECLQPCADAILMYETSKNNKMTNSYPISSKDSRKKREKSSDKLKFLLLSPVCEQDSSREQTPQLLKKDGSRIAPDSESPRNNLKEPENHSVKNLPMISANLFPDFSPESDTEVPRQITKTIPPETHKQDTNNFDMVNTYRASGETVTSENSGKTESSISNGISGPKYQTVADESKSFEEMRQCDFLSWQQKTHQPHKNDVNIKVTSQKHSCHLENSGVEKRLPVRDQTDTSREDNPDQTVSSEKSSTVGESNVMDLSKSPKQCNVADREYFKHTYRLYYDDDDARVNLDVSKNYKMSEKKKLEAGTPKDLSLQAKQQDLLLVNGYRNQTARMNGIPSNAKSDCGENSSSSLDNTLLSAFDPQSLSQLSPYRPYCTQEDSSLSNVQAVSDEHRQTQLPLVTVISSSENYKMQSENSLQSPCFSKQIDEKQVVVPALETQKDKSHCLKLDPSVHHENDQHSATPSSHVSESDITRSNRSSQTNFSNFPQPYFFDKTPTYDESSSYKPKNSQPISNTTVSGICPSLQPNLYPSSLHVSKNGQDVASGATSYASSNCFASNIQNTNASQSQIMNLSSLRIKKSDGNNVDKKFSVNGFTSLQQQPVSVASTENNLFTPLVTYSLTNGNSPTSYLPPKNKNGYRSQHHQLVRPESYPNKRMTNYPFTDDPSGFLRTSSPCDFFSVLPYKDYIVYHTGTDTETLIPSDADSESTVKSSKSITASTKQNKKRMASKETKTSKGVSKDKHRDHSKGSAETSNSSHHHPSDNNFKMSQSNHPRRHRHEGVILRTHEQKSFYPQYPRHSTELNTMTCNAFPSNTLYFPHYNTRPMSHPHVDGSHIHTKKHSNRHTTAHAELSKNNQGQRGPDSHIGPPLLPKKYVCPIPISSSRSSPSTTAMNSNATPSESGWLNINSPGISEDVSGPKTDARPGPDLLPLSDNQGGDIPSKDKSLSVKKAHSFFSRLTHSPMSFFYRDSKTANPSK